MLIRGSTTSQTRFGDFSSVAVDPQVPAGTCAVAAQQYFRVGGTWNTRLARVGTCQPPVLVPDVLNDSLPEANQVVAAASLTVGQVTNVVDPTCNNIEEPCSAKTRIQAHRYKRGQRSASPSASDRRHLSNVPKQVCQVKDGLG